MVQDGRIASDRQIEYLIRADYPLVYVVTNEEARSEQALRRIALDRKRAFFHWSLTEGVVSQDGRSAGDQTRDPQAALEHVFQTKDPAIYVLRDFHPFLKAPFCVRRLRDLAAALPNTKRTVVLLGPVLELKSELEKDVAVVDYDLPTREVLRVSLDKALGGAPRGKVEMPDEPLQERAIDAALGLTAKEAENVFSKSLVQSQRVDLDVVIAEKEQIIRKTGILDFLHPEETFEGIGGLELLKAWLAKRQKAFSREARDFGLPLPKGILLLGIPGCGKSLTAKAVGSLWKMPLLRLDIGKVFGSLVGSSEEHIRVALKTAESVAPCILWLDELEKGLSGVASSGVSDAGTTARVFGTFVTWLQEKRSPVFVLATANQVSLLPPELLRKGRFDEIFYVDLPTEAERREIFRIHLAKRGRDPANYDLDALVGASEGYSGSEIEQAVISALFDAYDEKPDGGPGYLPAAMVLHALEETVPLSRTMQEEISRIRDWSRTRARFASQYAHIVAEKGPARKLEIG
ncbi:MAG: AAA family ATPase [Planctomycetes bacterium]|nr:AAA family ATPase [Planctomycetota bacterium]